MKICWDNLEDVYLTKNGFFRKGSATYIYKESCAKCGESYLMNKHKQSKFCSLLCVRKGENHPMYGKTHSIKTRKEMSKSASGILNWNYKGGISSLGLSAYITYKDILGLYEDIRKQEGTEVLEVKCAYCGRWFAPNCFLVKNRINAANRLNRGECRLYCSENCKLACPTYGQRKYPKGFKHTSSREVSPVLRKMVLERDNWTCQICGKTSKEAQLHCHHMDPATQNPMFQNDMDSCITLCKHCHKMVHSRRGCRYVDLQCKTETDYTKKLKRVKV